MSDPYETMARMTEREVPSRHRWLPSAIPVLFGKEPQPSDPWPVLLDGVAKFAALATDIRDAALRDAEGLDAVATELLLVDGDSWLSSHGDDEDLGAPMRVVLMGRTMAGKSSLLSALSGAHSDRIGDGRQRFSRDVFEATTTASDRIEVVDTPGVGARDGAEDFDKAFSAALSADLILWVASSDSIQEETARALRLLGFIGKPIIVALNCRQSIEGVGRLNLLRFPDRVFGNREGLVEEIERHMAAAAVEPLDVVYVHALAATRAVANGELDAQLRAASRIDDLVDALTREHAIHSDSRRALRVVDSQRQPVEAIASALKNGSTTLHARAERDRSMNKDMHARLTRVVRSASETMASDIEAAVGRRRDWHLAVVDFGKSLQQAWEKELSALQAELSKKLDGRMSELSADMETTIADADAEWAAVASDQFALRNLTRFDSVFGNRLVRAGVGIGGALAGLWAGGQLGVAIGAAVGGPAAPITAAVGLVVGGVTGVALKPLKNLVDRLFLGTDGVLRKRRTEVATQTGRILDMLRDEYRQVTDEWCDKVQEHLANERAQSEDRSAELDVLAGKWTQHCEALGALTRELDKETTSALLRIVGRERLARSVKRSTRVPGVCILAEFEDSAFWEAWLYPPDIGERLAGGRAPIAGGEASGALSYALGLVEAPVRLLRADSASATLRIEDEIPVQIVETWSDALTAHIGKHVDIKTTRRANKG